MLIIKLFLTFFKIGAFTFGGGYAMLPLIQEEVIKNSWASLSELINFVAVSESTPGPFAINMATYIGSVKAGIFGAIFATLGVVLPSFIIILIVARFFEKFKENRIVAGCMTGLKSAVIGRIGAALVSMGTAVFFPNGFGEIDVTKVFVSLGIYLVMLFLSLKAKLHPKAVIGISALVGIVIMLVNPSFLLKKKKLLF